MYYKIHHGAGTDGTPRQFFYKGNVISFLQNPVWVHDHILPLPLSSLSDQLRVVFIGKELDRKQAVPLLAISRSRVRAALQFLIKHHPGYESVTLSDEQLNELPDDDHTIPDIIWSSISFTGDDPYAVDTAGTGYVDDRAPVTGTTGTTGATSSIDAIPSLSSHPTIPTQKTSKTAKGDAVSEDNHGMVGYSDNDDKKRSPVLDDHDHEPVAALQSVGVLDCVSEISSSRLTAAAQKRLFRRNDDVEHTNHHASISPPIRIYGRGSERKRSAPAAPVILTSVGQPKTTNKSGTHINSSIEQVN